MSLIVSLAPVAPFNKLMCEPLFRVSPLSGVDFILRNSPTQRKYLIETMPGGLALLDYNNDGLLDVFLVTQAMCPILCAAPRTLTAEIPRTGTGYIARTGMERSPM